MPLTDFDLQRLHERLGYVFKDGEWLALALTHRSVSGARNNERLEFLGDSILNFLIADFLYKTFPQEKEGRLSRLRATLVNQDSLASIARHLALGDVLRLGPGELKSGGFRRDSILADTVEAVLGAIYRDCADMVVCERVIRQWYGDRLSARISEDSMKDAKSRLQEWLQARHQSLPVYTVMNISGEAHDQQFRVRCEVSGLPTTEGVGSSRRHAEQDAAAQTLRHIESELPS